jgi:nickel-dependent lactate racemase
MLVKLPYGRGQIEIEAPDDTFIAYPRQIPGVSDVLTNVREALAHPIDCKTLRQLARGKPDATIVINDITRPVPTREMLIPILEELDFAGIQEDAVTIVIATGNHRPNTPEEIETLMGCDLFKKLRVINHNCEDFAQLTSIEVPGLSHPVSINSWVANASVKILTGLISPHQSAGYSGGRKSLVPGVASLDTIARHHSFPIRPYRPSMGYMQGNPFHELSVKIARAAGVDFIVNVIKNWRGQVVKTVAGDLVAAHEAGVLACRQSWFVDLPRKFDVVVVTPGGFPRDIDLHQAQKAIASAEQAVTEDGVIVLIAACQEGAGKFSSWFKNSKTPDDVIERFKREGFTREHSSKAFMCARALNEHRIIVACSGITQSELESMFFNFAASPQMAIDQALEYKGPQSSLLVMPYAVDCVPTLVK